MCNNRKPELCRAFNLGTPFDAVVDHEKMRQNDHTHTQNSPGVKIAIKELAKECRTMPPIA